MTVARLFPPGVAGWARTRDFSFGAGIFEGYDPPASPLLIAALERYIARFASDAWALDVSSKGVNAYSVAPEDAAEHIDTLVGRVESVVRELGELPAAGA